MALELYGHPFAAFVWKPLVAAYELQIPFVFRMVDPEHPEHLAKMAELSPTGQFPALVDGDIKITQSNAVVEYLNQLGQSEGLIPTDPQLALRARMLTDVFDDYVAVPMQQIVAEALRPQDQQDPRRVAEAKANLDRTYDWLSRQIQSEWAVADRFTIADCAAAPALFYADWVHAIPDGPLKDYRTRLLQRPSVVRTVNEARPYRKFFPLGAPDRD
ncbi:MAG TPA: glutathione S-transferase family protein [Aquabacterium sp.]|uniref:glutathione S-transferase family protein n=1 Tax=Aquabacterium sp. TaxID=1872578 RepID=UPI002E3763D0|nr:glutathione S-transferase family protein [Aquabacterium sp.]HEX5371616.1 glutathione S-transferase family protein [Aquabacterium sp.]